jgi:C4-dicarboxylate transporter, DctM subunit
VLLTAVTVALVFFMHVPLVIVHQNLFGSVNATPLLAVPFFIYAGELMGRGSVAQRLVDFVQAGVGSVRGSLGVTAVGTRRFSARSPVPVPRRLPPLGR